ncbi:ATP synthase F1 subunit delta [Alicyclobacillus tolerans]|uniref:ATP synthase subunit delta n=2 Tax=Alicyclobacillus tolerans TaxID=90970 RepID=A0ABT9LU15_9BACL|nr:MULTISPECIES: ATP synthase F1 subunit delta [Alicyclobacillus]MDP9727760.1 ATP synthase F1 delta subunit [Alicyclobacillus tengchongensis]QRF24442.1 ATP synthase F1 subunit delta [Alicyclobacillus sp. TC]SHK54268.1 ATP synthase F1 subcomplex delta subunit [Alicyclobacillus montanus]
MLNTSIARRYARALFNLAMKQQQVQAVQTSLQQVSQLLQDFKDARILIEHPLLSPEQKKAFLKSVFATNVDELTYRALFVLFEHKRSEYVDLFYQEFKKMADEAQNIVEIEIQTARPLKEEEKTEIEQKLAVLLGKSVRSTISVIPDLLGGYRARLGNRLLDATVTGALQQFAAQAQVLQRA